jgi:anti-sigma B factor antagonist
MRSVDLRISERDGLTVAALRGGLDVTDAAGMASALSTAAGTARTVIVDLAGLEYIDCSGLAALASAARHARRGGGDLLLAAPRQQVLRVLAVTRMASAFALHAGVDEAVSSQRRPGGTTREPARPGVVATPPVETVPPGEAAVPRRARPRDRRGHGPGSGPGDRLGQPPGDARAAAGRARAGPPGSADPGWRGRRGTGWRPAPHHPPGPGRAAPRARAAR